jgi:predicted alpha/beta-hydrolase family hydrolase
MESHVGLRGDFYDIHRSSPGFRRAREWAGRVAMRRVTLGIVIVTLGLLGPFIGAPPASAGEELVKLATRPGVQQPFWLIQPPAAPVASLILFPGGEGVVPDNGGAPGGNNFLVRVRDQFAAQGFLVAVLNVPSDHPSGLDSFRSSSEHAADVAAVIAYLRAKAAVPVWLVGTSRGTISAANAAARLTTGGANGLVLTSSIISAGRSRKPTIIGSVDVAKIALPTLFVQNKEDACQFCSFDEVPGLMNAFTRAPRHELIAVSGGSPPLGDPCGALSRHGYLGIEDQVVMAIARWIKGGG